MAIDRLNYNNLDMYNLQKQSAQAGFVNGQFGTKPVEQQGVNPASQNLQANLLGVEREISPVVTSPELGNNFDVIDWQGINQAPNAYNAMAEIDASIQEESIGSLLMDVVKDFFGLFKGEKEEPVMAV